jgi:hypothetical protein
MKFAPLLFSLGLLAGCAGDPPPERVPAEDRYDISRPGDRLLDGALSIEQINQPSREARADGYFHETRLRNRTDAAISAEFRTVWKDENDQQVAADEWRPLDIPAGGEGIADADATDPRARLFKLEVRRR